MKDTNFILCIVDVWFLKRDTGEKNKIALAQSFFISCSLFLFLFLSERYVEKRNLPNILGLQADPTKRKVVKSRGSRSKEFEVE